MRQPLFFIELWNMYDITQNGYPRTNNAAESWHDKLNRHLKCSKPSIYKLIDGLKTIQTTEEVNVVQIRNRTVDKRKRNKYQQFNEAFEKIVHEYHVIENKMEYIQSISDLVRFCKNKAH